MQGKDPSSSGGRFLPYASALGAILCWATLAAALYGSVRQLAPQQVLTYGMGIAGGALLAWDWIRGHPPWRTWPGGTSLLLGAYGIFGYHALLVGAFALAPAVQVNVLNYTWPLWILLLGAWAAGQRLTLRLAGAGLLGLTGTVAALEPWRAAEAGASVQGKGATAALGYTMALAAGLCWGSFTVLMRRRAVGRAKVAGPDRIAGSAQAMAWWCLQAAAISAVWMELSGSAFLLPSGTLPALVYIGVVPLGLAFLLWEHATRTCPLPNLGVLSYLTPPLSTLLLGWASGGTASGWAWTGLTLVLGGALLGSAVPRARMAGRRP